jgi:hypothetical protein
VAELKLGYKASAEQFAPRELVELAVAAEAHGMESASVSDHFQPWRHEGGHAPFSLAWMTAVGERTRRLQLGTSVLTPTFRYNPAVIAQAFATMACLYPDRVFLGVGTGEALNEVATGFVGEWPEFKERFARLRESVRLMRELWGGGRVDFDGDYYHLKGASIYDVPEDGVPVYIAAGGPAVAKYAGRAGDGFITCTILFCAGPLSLLGAVEDGLADQWRPLALKGVLDGFATMGLIATYGWSPLLAALPVLAYQGTLTLGVRALRPWVQEAALLDSLNVTGGLIVACVAVLIVSRRQVPITNYLPALLFAPLLTHWWA